MGSSGSSTGDDRDGVPVAPNHTYLRIQSVAIFVRDLERSLRFYVEQLGFDLLFDGRSRPGSGLVTVAPPDGTANLALVAPEPGSEGERQIGRSTQVSFVTEDVPAKFREWRSRGVHFLFAPRLRRLKHQVRVVNSSASAASQPSTAPPVWGGVFTRFADPDGNSFLLVSFDLVTREIEAQRRALAEKQEAERRAEQEMDFAKRVQARLFPQTLPPVPTLDYAGVCLPARAVGGDYYDFLNLGAGRLGLVVGDICGKGIAAALLMANLQANLRSLCAIASAEPERFLKSVNQLFHENTTDSSYATLFFAEYDDSERRLRYASCGHLSALLLRQTGALERLESTATVLGLFPEWECAVEERRLAPDDTLLLYTDGVTESFDRNGQEFGEARLIEALARHHRLTSREVLASIVEEVRRFCPHEQHDDITLIVAKCRFQP